MEEFEECSVRGCHFPIHWTAEKLCLHHILNRHLVDAPPEESTTPTTTAAPRTKATPKE